MKEQINITCELILNYIDSLLEKLHSKTVILDFFIMENHLFLETSYKEGSNKIIMKKSILNIDIEDISYLYQELYYLFKERYINSSRIKVQIFKEFDFGSINPFLSFKIHDIHLNEIDLRLKDLGHERDSLINLEEDIIKMYKSKVKTSIK